MALRNTKAAINGAGNRKLASWIARFVEHTEALEAPVVFRRWAAITTIAGVLEQKVWLMTTSPIYPNIYCFLVGHPGIGKTRVIRAAKSYLEEIPQFFFAPTSMTGASLVDALLSSKRIIVRLPDVPLEYNSMMITAEELTAFMHKYDDEMIGILSAFYDPDPYLQTRRGKEIRIKIKSPQLNVLSGTTPSNLIKFLPEFAWDQGFTSRVILAYSDEKIVGDDFAKERMEFDKELAHDLKIINVLCGEFRVSTDYQKAVNNWRALGEPPLPNHPKLLHYNSRRRVHLYKLSMVSSIDRSDSLELTVEDFNKAMGWLLEVELTMPEIFRAGSVGADAKVMEEIEFFIRATDLKQIGVSEHKVVKFASEKCPAHTVMRVLEIMERTGVIETSQADKKTGLRHYRIRSTA